MPTLSATARARLPDSAFAYIDSQGRRRLPINDVLDALGGYIAGPRSVRRIAPIVPSADQIRRITLEKSARVPRGRPLGQITLARYRRRRRS